MTARREPVRSDERPGPESADGPNRPDDESGSPCGRVMTDGGQAQLEEDEEAEESAEKADEESADEGSEDESAEAEPAPDDEAEPEEEAAEEEAESEEETTEDEMETDDEGKSHVEDAEDVYESDETSGVVHLDLDGIFLDLLGLEVNLNEVTLDVSARPGENNLLGNLLSAVSGLLDGPSAVVDKVKTLLGKPAEFFSGLLERPREFLSNLLSKPKAVLSSLFGFGAEGAEEAEAESEPEDEAAEAEEEEDAEAGPGRLSRAFGWLKEKLAGLVPGFPLEEIVATVVREVIQAVIDQLEPEEEQEPEEAEPAQAEA